MVTLSETRDELEGCWWQAGGSKIDSVLVFCAQGKRTGCNESTAGPFYVQRKMEGGVKVP